MPLRQVRATDIVRQHLRDIPPVFMYAPAVVLIAGQQQTQTVGEGDAVIVRFQRQRRPVGRQGVRDPKLQGQGIAQIGKRPGEVGPGVERLPIQAFGQHDRALGIGLVAAVVQQVGQCGRRVVIGRCCRSCSAEQVDRLGGLSRQQQATQIEQPGIKVGLSLHGLAQHPFGLRRLAGLDQPRSQIGQNRRVVSLLGCHRQHGHRLCPAAARQQSPSQPMQRRRIKRVDRQRAAQQGFRFSLNRSGVHHGQCRFPGQSVLTTEYPRDGLPGSCIGS